jgi:hypothetical protein
MKPSGWKKQHSTELATQQIAWFRQLPHNFSTKQINTYSITKAHSELDQQYSTNNA